MRTVVDKQYLIYLYVLSTMLVLTVVSLSFVLCLRTFVEMEASFAGELQHANTVQLVVFAQNAWCLPVGECGIQLIT